MNAVLVIGGGVIGLLTAHELLQAGCDVTLIEKGDIGRESSWAGGGILCPLYPWRSPAPITALTRWSQAAFPELATNLRNATALDPEHWINGLLVLDMEDADAALAWSASEGTRIERVDSSQLRGLEPELREQGAGALLLPEIGQIRNPRFVQALRQALRGRVQMREQEEVLELIAGTGAVGVRTAKATYEADQVVICTGAWTGALLDRFAARPDIRPIRGQMILFHGQPEQIHRVTLYRDHYVIPRLDGRVLIGSTIEDTGFVKATTAEAKEELYRAATELFPLLKRTPIEDHWAGLRPGSPNGIPYIGPHPDLKGVFFNAGHFRNGLTMGPASARLAVDLMLGRDPILDPAPYALDAPRS